MQQPEISKNCPVCRQSIETTKKQQDQRAAEIQQANANSTDEDRRTDRLLKHMTTLYQMKEKFISELQKQILKDSQSFQIEDFEMIKTILSRNFRSLVVSFKEDNSILNDLDFGEEENSISSSLESSVLKLSQNEIDSLGMGKIKELEMLIASILFSEPEKVTHSQNQLNSIGMGFSIPSMNSQTIPYLKHLKMEIMGQLFRVYRSRKHLDFTSTRSYLHILAKQRNLS